jgi:hypothetical protein
VVVLHFYTTPPFARVNTVINHRQPRIWTRNTFNFATYRTYTKCLDKHARIFRDRLSFTQPHSDTRSGTFLGVLSNNASARQIFSWPLKQSFIINHRHVGNRYASCKPAYYTKSTWEIRSRLYTVASIRRWLSVTPWCCVTSYLHNTLLMTNTAHQWYHIPPFRVHRLPSFHPSKIVRNFATRRSVLYSDNQFE